MQVSNKWVTKWVTDLLAVNGLLVLFCYPVTHLFYIVLTYI